MERKEYTYTEKKDTRSGFGDGLYEIGKKNKNVVALCADLTGSLKMNQFKNDFKERFFQVGIAEANMMGIAAGMTIGGKIPYTGTFANFSTGRVYDQIRQSIAYSGKNVKICASHAGLTLGEDGLQASAMAPLQVGHNTRVARKVLSPTITMAKLFYTDNGVPITEDRNYDFNDIQTKNKYI